MVFLCCTKRCPAGGSGTFLIGKADVWLCVLDALLELSESEDVAFPEDDLSEILSSLELLISSAPSAEPTQTSLSALMTTSEPF